MDAEKIICCDRGNSGFETAALMNGGMGNWNNPFIYLVWMMFANRMWGNGWENGGMQRVLCINTCIRVMRHNGPTS